MATDTSFPKYMHYGTNAQRLAFTPAPSSGQPIYVWYETDTGATYLYDTSWHAISSSGVLPATVQGDMLYASAANTVVALTKDANATRYLSNTGSSNNPAWAQVALATGVSGDLPFANLTQIAATSVLGVTGNATADVAAITGSAVGQVLRYNSSSDLSFSLLGVPQYIVVAADESDADNTLHNDAELLFSVGANQIWVVELTAYFTSGASNTPDVNTAWSFPASATFTNTGFGFTLAATTANTIQVIPEYQPATPSTTVGYGVLTSASLSTSPVTVTGVLRTGATTGTLQFQWAQNVTTGGTPTVRKKDSWMRYTRIS